MIKALKELKSDLEKSIANFEPGYYSYGNDRDIEILEVNYFNKGN